MSAPTILHVIPGLRIGGAELMLARLTAAELEGGSRPVVADLMGGGVLASEIRAAGVPVHELGLQRAVAAPRTLYRLTRLIQLLKPDVVQSWMYYGDLFALWALERSGLRDATRLYWGVRCSDLDLSRYGVLLRWAVGACAQRAGRPDAVVANSFAGRVAHRKLGYVPRAFPVIANGIDTERFRPDARLGAATRRALDVTDEQTLVIHVARVDPMKDHATFLAVASALPDVRFLAVGSGTEHLTVPRNVTALGQRSDLPALYAAADLALSSAAFGEGFPNVVAEAMACGVPVVATDVGDSRWIVAETGHIVPPRDRSALAESIRNLLSESRDQRCRRALACRARIESDYSLEQAVGAFRDLHLNGVLPAEHDG
jgi:glycosyltransferase involved in cell wall biosynthesis